MSPTTSPSSPRSVRATGRTLVGEMGGGSLPRADNTVAYTLTVANNGNQGAAGVTITATVPDHSVFAPDHSTPGWVSDLVDGSAGASALGRLAGAVGAYGEVTC